MIEIPHVVCQDSRDMNRVVRSLQTALLTPTIRRIEHSCPFASQVVIDEEISKQLLDGDSSGLLLTEPQTIIFDLCIKNVRWNQEFGATGETCLIYIASKTKRKPKSFAGNPVLMALGYQMAGVEVPDAGVPSVPQNVDMVKYRDKHYALLHNQAFITRQMAYAIEDKIVKPGRKIEDVLMGMSSRSGWLGCSNLIWDVAIEALVKKYGLAASRIAQRRAAAIKELKHGS